MKKKKKFHFSESGWTNQFVQAILLVDSLLTEKSHWYIEGNLKNAEREEGETKSKPFQAQKTNKQKKCKHVST